MSNKNSAENTASKQGAHGPQPTHGSPSTTSQSSSRSSSANSGWAASSGKADREDLQVLMEEVGQAVRDYSRKRPGVAGGLLFAVGFFVGWRLRPW